LAEIAGGGARNVIILGGLLVCEGGVWKPPVYHRIARKAACASRLIEKVTDRDLRRSGGSEIGTAALAVKFTSNNATLPRGRAVGVF
jgi:hypothetical protein